MIKSDKWPKANDYVTGFKISFFENKLMDLGKFRLNDYFRGGGGFFPLPIKMAESQLYLDISYYHNSLRTVLNYFNKNYRNSLRTILIKFKSCFQGVVKNIQRPVNLAWKNCQFTKRKVKGGDVLKAL
jgi:hypothetical protein